MDSADLNQQSVFQTDLLTKIRYCP